MCRACSFQKPSCTECGSEIGCATLLENNSVYVGVMKLFSGTPKPEEDEAFPPSQTSQTSSLASISSISMADGDFSPLSKSSKSSDRSPVSRLRSQDMADTPSARPTDKALPKFNLQRSMSARHCLRRRQRRTFLMIARPNASTFFADALTSSAEGIRRAEEDKRAQTAIIPGTRRLLDHHGHIIQPSEDYVEFQTSVSADLMPSRKSLAHSEDQMTTTNLDTQQDRSQDAPVMHHSNNAEQEHHRYALPHASGGNSPRGAGSPKSMDVWAMEFDEADDARHETVAVARRSGNNTGFIAAPHDLIEPAVTGPQMPCQGQQHEHTVSGHVHRDTEKSDSARAQNEDAEYTTHDTVDLAKTKHANLDLTNNRHGKEECAKACKETGSHGEVVEEPSTTSASSSQEIIAHGSKKITPKENRINDRTADTQRLGTVCMRSAAISRQDGTADIQSLEAACVNSATVSQPDSVAGTQSLELASMDYASLTQSQLREECKRRGLPQYGSNTGLGHTLCIRVPVFMCVCACVPVRVSIYVKYTYHIWHIMMK